MKREILNSTPFGIGTIDSLTYLGQPMRPSLGLSGVVTGMLALLMYFAPRVKVSFFFWFIVSIGSIGLPAWLIGLWYIGWDADLHFERPSPLSFRAQREISLRNSATSTTPPTSPAPPWA